MAPTSGSVPTATQNRAAAAAPQQVLAQFPTYAGAEQLVDRLSDAGFAVEHCRIVGNGLHTVEYVTGRLTSARAAAAGAGSGAWFGLWIGLLLGIFSYRGSYAGTIVVCAALGALWGAVFGYVAHRATRGSRDFASVKGLEADQYAVSVDSPYADDARRLAGLL